MQEDKLQRRVRGVDSAPTLPPVPEARLEDLADTFALLRDAGTPTMVAKALRSIGAEYAAARQPLIDAVNLSLVHLTGKSFQSFEANQRLVNALAEFARSLGLRFECQKPGCGAPSSLVLNTPQGMPAGAFSFRQIARKPSALAFSRNGQLRPRSAKEKKTVLQSFGRLRARPSTWRSGPPKNGDAIR